MEYNLASQQTSNVIFFKIVDGKQVEMLRISPEGFYVRSVKLESVGQQEAREVYDALRAFVGGLMR